jgi:hypothetical protein
MDWWAAESLLFFKEPLFEKPDARHISRTLHSGSLRVWTDNTPRAQATLMTQAIPSTILFEDTHFRWTSKVLHCFSLSSWPDENTSRTDKLTVTSDSSNYRCHNTVSHHRHTSRGLQCAEDSASWIAHCMSRFLLFGFRPPLIGLIRWWISAATWYHDFFSICKAYIMLNMVPWWMISKIYSHWHWQTSGLFDDTPQAATGITARSVIGEDDHSWCYKAFQG